MNEEAWQKTMRTGRAVFWSTSENKLWHKDEMSGNIMEVEEVWLDCDGDALLLLVTVKGDGKACHKGFRSRFHHPLCPRCGNKISTAKAALVFMHPQYDDDLYWWCVKCNYMSEA